MSGTWLAGWATAPMGRSTTIGPFDDGFPPGTIRQRVPLVVSGPTVRLRLSNAYGSAPVTFESAQMDGTPVRFSGAATITIAAGADVVSDDIEVAASNDPLIELQLAQATGHPTRGLSGAVSTFTSSP